MTRNFDIKDHPLVENGALAPVDKGNFYRLPSRCKASGAKGPSPLALVQLQTCAKGAPRGGCRAPGREDL
jgi:hypothetical protein